MKNSFLAGKFNKHIDLWDALEPENQEYLSREGVSHVFSQLTASASTPDLETPNFTILKKKKKYEVRRCSLPGKEPLQAI